MTDNREDKCQRCGNPYPVKGVMVCPCHPMFSPDYEPETLIEFKTEEDCHRFILWMKVLEKKHEAEISQSSQKAREEVVGEIRKKIIEHITFGNHCMFCGELATGGHKQFPCKERVAVNVYLATLSTPQKEEEGR